MAVSWEKKKALTAKACALKIDTEGGRQVE